MRVQQARDTALCHAIDLDQPAGHPPQHFGLEISRKRRGSAVFEFHCRQIEPIKIRILHQPPVLHRHQHGVGHLLVLRLLQPGRDIELAHDRNAAARIERGQEHHHRRVGIERGGRQRTAAQPVIVGRAKSHLPPTHGVAVDDPFGGAGGAGGIDDVEGIVGRWFERRRSGPGGGHEPVQLLIKHDLARTGQSESAEFGQFYPVNKQMDRARIRHHRCQLLRAGAGGERRSAASGADRGQEHQRVLDGRCAKDGHGLAALQPIGLKPRRYPFDQIGGLTPAQPSRAIVERGRIPAVFAPGSYKPRKRAKFRIQLHCRII